MEERDFNTVPRSQLFDVIDERDKIRADLAAAQRELAAYRQAVDEYINAQWLHNRVAEILKDKGNG